MQFDARQNPGMGWKALPPINWVKTLSLSSLELCQEWLSAGKMQKRLLPRALRAKNSAE